MALMVERGFQEQGEAAGKWRRVQLTSTQLCTYYVGYCEVRDLVADLRRATSELEHRADCTTRCSAPGRRPRAICARCSSPAG